MKYFSRLCRLFRINYILVRYNLDEIIFAMPLFYPLRFLSYLNPWYWFLKNKLTRGERIRLALEDLGPIFIKAGQIISTRRDILPDDIALELAKLQDQVPPFSGKTAEAIIEQALEKPLQEIFSEFDSRALASASIAQVHAASLPNGQQVVVKVLRPHIQKNIVRDLDLLAFLAKIADRYSVETRRFKPQEIIAEIAHTLQDELDLMREGANASQLRRNFQNSKQLYVPEIIWPYCRTNVLVIERIQGVPIHNIDLLKSLRFDMKKIATLGIEIFFTQVFRDSFFHADMHPGNIFISTDNSAGPKYIAVDFGIMGSLNSNDQRYLAENMLAFFKRDYQRVAELHIQSGWLPPNTRVDQFEGAIRAVCEPIFEKPLKDISFGQLLLRLFQTARAFHINIQPQLILLQKTLLNIEGVGRQLYPELDLWETASPFLEKWLKKQVGVKAFIRRIKDNLPFWSEKLPEIPGLIYDVLKQQNEQQKQAIFLQANPQIDQMINKSKPIIWYAFLSGMISAFLLSGLVFYLLKLVS